MRVSGGLIARIVIGVVLAVILISQARRLTGQPHRRRAFWLGAAALLCFTVFNVTLGMVGTVTPVVSLIGIAGVALFFGAAMSLIFSLRSGERSRDHAQITSAAQAFHNQREHERADKSDTHES